MKKGGIGGANTKTGLVFEGKIDLGGFLNSQPGYKISGHDVYYQSNLVAKIFKQHKFCDIFLKELGINWKDIISSKLLPDNSIFVIVKNNVYIIECKFQQGQGSVDEKLQTCDFKKKQYKKLLSRANINVEYMYLLSDWFRKDKYKDALDYVISVGCKFYFEYLPLSELGLPVPEK